MRIARKKILEKKAKQQHYHKQTQVWEGKPIEEKNKDSMENVNVDGKPHASPDVVKETASVVVASGNGKVTESNSLPESGDITEKKLVANGIANGC